MSRNKSRIAIALGIMFSAGTTLGLAGDDIGNPNPQNEMELRNAALTDPLSITIDAAGDTIVLPVGTVVGKQEAENAGAETELKNVMLIAPLTFTFTDSTGQTQTVTLPANTTIQKLEVEPNEFKLVAVDANGNVIQRINNEVGEDEAEHAADAARRRNGQAVANANRERNELRNVTLTAPVTVTIDAAGDTIVLPAGTIVGKQEMKNGETELKNVTLAADLSFTNPTTNQTVMLPAGTRIQKIEVEPNEFKLHAVEPDGTVVRIRNEAGENEEAAEHAANANRGRDSPAASATSGRDRGRDETAKMENEVEEQAEHAATDVNRGPGSANSDAGRPERAGDPGDGDRGDRVERAVAAAMDRPSSGDRPQRVDRVERSDHSGRH